MWKSTNNPDNKIEFKRLRATCIKIMRKDHKQYINSIQVMAKKDLRNFWKYINSKRKENAIPSEMVLGDVSAHNGNSIANLFACHFKSAYTMSTTKQSKPDHDQPYHCNDNYLLHEMKDELHTQEIQCDEIVNAIKSLKSTYHCGPDGIPSVIIKECAHLLIYPLSKIFTKSLVEGIFPDKWKTSYVHPVFKQGDRGFIKNYRPVCPMSSLSSAFENILYSRLVGDVKNKLSDKQHGFIPGKSIITNLM